MDNNNEKKLNGTVIVTYRCNARCSMCNRYKAPSKPEEEISIETIKKLPKMYFTNITGGEPFIRTDLKDIVRELYKKSDRIVISTNGFFTDRIVDLCKEFPQIGIRISIEGLEQTNNEIRGLQNGYQRGYGTLKKLREMGMKDVGFGMTVQDKNAPDLVPLYKISNEMGMEFATASLHNSFYFVEAKNIIHDRPMVAKNFENLVNELLRSNSPKKWFRAYFNHGLINYIYGQKRLLPCDMSFDTFFIDPYGDVMPCVASQKSRIPVINAGDGGHQHPTQTLTDLMTIRSLKGRLGNITIGLCGDLKFGRTVHSLINALIRYENVKFILISPEELKIPDYIREDVLQANHVEFEEVERLEDAMSQLDVLYMTRVQKERFFNEEDYIRLKDFYILTKEKMELAKDDMIVLHPLPRVNEISVEVDDDPRAAYFTQVQNGVYVRMALILTLLGIEVE